MDKSKSVALGFQWSSAADFRGFLFLSVWSSVSVRRHVAGYRPENRRRGQGEDAGFLLQIQVTHTAAHRHNLTNSLLSVWAGTVTAAHRPQTLITFICLWLFLGAGFVVPHAHQVTPTSMTSASSCAAPASPANLVPNGPPTTPRATSRGFPSAPLSSAWSLGGCAQTTSTTRWEMLTLFVLLLTLWCPVGCWLSPCCLYPSGVCLSSSWASQHSSG